MTPVVLSFLASLCICFAMVPMWIKVCTKWNLFESGGERKHHVRKVPSMGGIAIFSAVVISFLSFANCSNHPEIKFIVAGSAALFFTGLFDDLLDINALKKLLIQAGAAILVVANGIQLNSAESVLGVSAISWSFGFFLSVFVILFITNAFNFIDGLDGLASFMGLLITSIFGVLFALNDEFTYASLSFSIAGALIAFLYYNFEPAKVFMGDSGSLIIGFVISILTIKLFNMSSHENSTLFSASPNMIVATLFIIIFDLSRVSFIRIVNGGSPFKADRSHIHHMITRQQFGHRGTTLIMTSFNILFIVLALLLPSISFVSFFASCYAIAIFLINNKTVAILSIFRTKLIGAPVKKLEVN